MDMPAGGVSLVAYVLVMATLMAAAQYYIVSNVMLFSAQHIRNNFNKVWMAILMGTLMAVVRKD